MVLCIQLLGTHFESGHESSRRALDSLTIGETVLADRYARGEISEQEYRDRQAVLRQRRH